MGRNQSRSKFPYILLFILCILGYMWVSKESMFTAMYHEVFPCFGQDGQPLLKSCYQSMYTAFEEELLPLLSMKKKQGTRNQKVANTPFVSENYEPTKKQTKSSLKKWRNPNYLRKYVYQVDSTTMVTNGEINGARLLSLNLSLPKEDKPQILIYHTHGSEGYKNSKKRKADTVIGVGDVLAACLEKYGFRVIHDRHVYDVVNGKEERSKAYNYAANAVENYLKKYPSIQVVMDIHRDGVKESTKLVTTQNKVKMAQIMFFNGASRTARNGDIRYLVNKNKLYNFAFSLQLQADAAKHYPGFTRKIYIKGYRYNLHYRGRSLLVEVGAQNNTVQEAKNSMYLLAQMLNRVL